MVSECPGLGEHRLYRCKLVSPDVDSSCEFPTNETWNKTEYIYLGSFEVTILEVPDDT